MKAIRFMMMAVMAVFVSTSFVSCLDDDGNQSDGQGWFEVRDAGFYTTLVSDVGNLTLTPKNPSILQNNGNYYKHVFVIFSFPEGDPGFVEGKTQYDVIIDRVDSINVNEMCDSDTLSHRSGFYELFNNYTWASHSYLTVGFTAPILASTTIDHFNLYMDKAEGNVLYMKLNQNQKTDTGVLGQQVVPLSFQLPIRTLVEKKFPDLEFFGSQSDSVYVIVTSDTYGSSSTQELKTEKIKVGLKNYYYY